MPVCSHVWKLMLARKWDQSDELGGVVSQLNQRVGSVSVHSLHCRSAKRGVFMDTR